MCDKMKKVSTPLHFAVRDLYEGINLRNIKLLLKKNASDINVGNAIGETPLHMAARRSILISEPLIKMLLNYGADANVANMNGDTVLHIMTLALNGEFTSDLIKILVKRGADLNAVNLIGNTPLHTAAQNNDYTYHYRLCCLLLQHGAKMNIANVNGDTPLHLVARHAQRYLSTKLIEKLIKHGADVGMMNVEGDTPFHVLFLQDGLSTTFEHLSVFIKQSRNVNVCNSKGETPLHLAVRKRSFCNTSLIKLLLDYGADVSKKDAAGENVYQAYCKAVSEDENRQKDPMIEILLQSDEQKHMNLSLHVASLFHRVDSVQKLLSIGADVNAVDASGYSPLLYALVAHGDNAEKIETKCSTVRLLLDYGADINHQFALFHVPMFPYFSRRENSILGIMHFGIQGMHSKDTLAMREPFFQHMAKLLTLRDKLAETGCNIEVVSENNSYYYDFLENIKRVINKYDDWRFCCSKELSLMSQTEMGDSKVTFFSFLLASEKQAAIYAKNKVMVEEFHAKKTLFPMYQGMLEAKLSKEFERLKLIENAAISFSNALQFADPTDEFFERTLSYCSNRDLMCLIEGMAETEDAT